MTPEYFFAHATALIALWPKAGALLGLILIILSGVRKGTFFQALGAAVTGVSIGALISSL
jgi:hypothetical protein